MEDRPEGLIDIGESVMSNFDHQIDLGIAKKLKDGKYYSGYPAYNFHGTVWYDNGKWKCKIKRYRIHIDTIIADTLEEIMNEASEKYGDD